MNATHVLPALRGRDAVAVVQQHCELVGVGHADELVWERPTGVRLVVLGLGLGLGLRLGLGLGLGERSGAEIFGRHHATPSLDSAMHALPVPELPFQVHEHE